MANVSIARRYARALLEVAAETNSADRVSEQLSALAEAYEQNPELRDVVVNPAYGKTQKHAVMDALLRQAGVSEPGLLNLVRLLVDRQRLAHVVDLARLFRDMADSRAGRVRGKVTSAVPLGAEVVQRLGSQLKKLTQRDVILEARVDPTLLGGVSTQLGSLLFDGSLKSQLEELRGVLKRA